jgi:hypothetical protein
MHSEGNQKAHLYEVWLSPSIIKVKDTKPELRILFNNIFLDPHPWGNNKIGMK